MISKSSFLLHGATIITGEGTGTGSVGICGERISGVWYPDDEGMVRFNDREIAFDALPDEFRKTYPESETEDIRGKILMAAPDRKRYSCFLACMPSHLQWCRVPSPKHGQ